MSFEEPNYPRSCQIINNQIQLTELATYEEQDPGLLKVIDMLEQIKTMHGWEYISELKLSVISLDKELNAVLILSDKPKVYTSHPRGAASVYNSECKLD